MKAADLIAKVPRLPPPSPAVAQMLALLGRPESDNEDITRVVKQDGVLSAKLLAMCNSAALGLAAPVSSVDQAVMYLGHAEIHRLVMALSFGGAMAPRLPGYAMDENALWRHALLTALATEKVVAATRGLAFDASVAYTAGLIHDLGKVLLSHALDAPTRTAVQRLVESGATSLVEAEKSVLGTDHAEVGAYLLQQWRLPEALVEAVANHHCPPVASGVALSAVVHVGDVVAHGTGSCSGWGSFAVRADESVLAALGIGPLEVQNLIIETFDAIEKAEAMIAAA